MNVGLCWGVACGGVGCDSEIGCEWISCGLARVDGCGGLRVAGGRRVAFFALFVGLVLLVGLSKLPFCFKVLPG